MTERQTADGLINNCSIGILAEKSNNKSEYFGVKDFAGQLLMTGVYLVMLPIALVGCMVDRYERRKNKIL